MKTGRPGTKRPGAKRPGAKRSGRSGPGGPWRKDPAEKRGPQYPARPGAAVRGTASDDTTPGPAKAAGRNPNRGSLLSDRPRDGEGRRSSAVKHQDATALDRLPQKGPSRAAAKAQISQALATGVQMLVVSEDEAGMRVDRFLETRFPSLSFGHIQRVIRKGELRVDGKRADSKDRLVAAQTVRVPPIKLADADDRPKSTKPGSDTARFLKDITLYEDADVLVLNKPAGLAVQGGSGTVRHVDGMLDAIVTADGQRARLVHRLDKDTAGCLLIAKSRFAAAALAKTFRSRSARKVYWAMVAGVPRVRQGRISTYLARDEARDGDARVNVVQHGDDGAMHAVSYYAVVETSAQKLAWLSLKPVTGRTHQLRAHAAHIGHPIIGDPKYFNVENWELPGGIQNKLHLLARRIVVPHPRGKGVIDVSAPLPPHMLQSWNLLGLDVDRFDPVVDAPDE